MKRKITSIFLIILITLTMSGCRLKKCTNCNPQGTPYPTLSPEEIP